MRNIKKLKKFYKEHRVFVILMIIVVICLSVTLFFGLRYFYFGTGETNRETCPEIKESVIKESEDMLTKEETVKTAEVVVNEKSPIVYTTIEYNENISLADAQGKAIIILENFSEEDKECYDFQFILKQDKTETTEGFKIIGSLNASGTGLSWNKNSPVSNVDEEK